MLNVFSKKLLNNLQKIFLRIKILLKVFLLENIKCLFGQIVKSFKLLLINRWKSRILVSTLATYQYPNKIKKILD